MPTTNVPTSVLPADGMDTTATAVTETVMTIPR